MDAKCLLGLGSALGVVNALGGGGSGEITNDGTYAIAGVIGEPVADDQARDGK